MKKPLILMILDGFGCGPESGNAIKAANKPNIDRLFANNPITHIGASGLCVGLPEGQMGNSEVGHTNIGAGRVVYQELTRITKSIKDGDFFENPAFIEAYSYLATIYLEVGDIQKAVSFRENALTLIPNDIDSYLKFGQLYKEMNLRENAEYCYEKVLEIDLNNKIAIDYLNK